MGRYSSILEALIARIESHQAADGLLEGWKLVVDPTQEVEGKKDLPVIRLLLPETVESISPVLIADGVLTINLTISTSRKDGLLAFMQGLETVLDALVTNDEGVIDLSIDGTLCAPATIAAREVHALDLSYNAVIEITGRSLPIIPGRRAE